MAPSRPVAQKSQASAQPACELTQTMYLPAGSGSSRAAWPSRRRCFSARASAGSGSGIRTASTAGPSGRRNRYFTKPSADRAALDDLQFRELHIARQRLPRRPAQPRHAVQRAGPVPVHPGEDPPGHHLVDAMAGHRRPQGGRSRGRADTGSSEIRIGQRTAGQVDPAQVALVTVRIPAAPGPCTGDGRRAPTVRTWTPHGAADPHVQSAVTRDLLAAPSWIRAGTAEPAEDSRASHSSLS